MSAHQAHRHSLGPEELKSAASAFERALEQSSDICEEMHPLVVRKSIAKAVMEGALSGERDEARLQERALARLREATAQASRRGADGRAKLDLPKKEL